MNHPIRRLAIALLVVLGIIALDVTYLQVIAGPDYRDDPRNPRVAATRSATERGPIVTREGVVLAESLAVVSAPQDFRRSYPEGELFAHVVGYTTLLFGDSGLEQTRSRTLRSGADLTISGIIDELLGREQGAEGLRLTVAASVQQTAARALGDQRGAVVALEPRTGEVLAMYSSPTFAPADLQGTDPTLGDLLAADPRLPLTNRAIELRVAPGSTFKVITTAAALEAGLASPDTEFEDVAEFALPGSTATIANADGEPCGPAPLASLVDAFVRSCNTVFAMLGIQVGSDQLNRTAAAFGFNRNVDFELETVESVSPPEADDAAVAQAAIGQRSVQATPLQLAMMAAAVANDGRVMRPFVVSEVFDRSLNITSAAEPIQLRRAVSPGTAAELQRLMEAAVSRGTGLRATISDAVVGGKTGTAEVPGGNPHAWFAGYGLAEGRAIAVAVLVQNGGDAGADATGGSTAAPIARAVMEAWLQP